MFSHDKNAVVDEPKDIVEAINKHWARTFERNFEPNMQDIHVWLNECDCHFHCDNVADWLPSEEDIIQVILHSGDSATGPDGFPFKAFRQVPELAAKVILELTRDMALNEGMETSEYFNHVWCALLPKKPHHVDPRWGDVYSPENLRPLSIVGCFNRIIAGAFRVKLAQKMDNVIGEAQKGLMAGRQIVEYVLEIDWEMIKASKGEGDSAAILFDSTAAFFRQ